MAANAKAAGQAHAPPPPPLPQLNPGLQQQLNLEDVRHRAQDLLNAISRIRQHLEANQNVKWQDVLGQFSVVNMGLVTIVEDIKKVSKAFVVYPKNVNQENSTKLPVMLSSKLLPEMELEETARKEQILGGLSSLPVLTQVEKLKSRIDAIGAACSCAEKTINDSRKVYELGTRHTPGSITPLDKVQVAKIEEQEKLLRAAANHGEALRLPVDQRIEPTVLPSHLESGLASVDGDTSFVEATGALYSKNSSSASPSIVVTNPGASHPVASATQPIGRSAPSPMAGTGGISTDNTTASPMQYANSPRSGPSMMNVPSPQQQQRVKVPHIPQQPQSYPSQQLRAQPTHANIQTHIPPSQEQQNQLQAKHQQERPSYQNYGSRQFLPGSAQQHGITTNTSAQGSQSKHHVSVTGNPANLYGGNTNFSSSQMFNVPSGYPRSLSQQAFPETGYNVGASGGSQSSTNMVLSQQHGGPSNFPTYSNPQFSGQSNLSSANLPLGGSSTFTGLPNHPSNFPNIVNLTQNPLHGQSNYGNAPNPTQNPNYGHPRQPPPQ